MSAGVGRAWAEARGSAIGAPAVIFSQSEESHTQNSTITPSKKTPLAAYKVFIPSVSGGSIWSQTLPHAIGFPAEVSAVTRMLQPETRGHQETLETLLRSK